jgi:hypothetical protein
MKGERKKPTVKRGLKRGAKGTKELASSKEGRRMLLFLFGSMFWLFYLMPVSCNKLNETFPGTGIGFFVGFATYVAWVAYLIIMKNKGRPITWPTPQKPKRATYVRHTRVVMTAVRQVRHISGGKTEQVDDKDENSKDIQAK